MLRGMLADGVVEVARGPVYLSRPFTVPRKDRPDPRLVLDLSRLNKTILCPRFRMLTIMQVRHSLHPGAWFTALDLANAYWHVPVHPRFRPYLAMQVGCEVLQFRVMPYGLNVAPRIFTKVTRELAVRLVEAGVSVLLYLDDWLLQADSREEAVFYTDVALRISQEMGFAFNLPKSHLTPTQSIQWLGMEWDSTTLTLRLSSDNVKKLRQRVREALFSVTFTKRLWYRLMGTLNFAAAVVPLGRLRCRRLWWQGNRIFRGLEEDTLTRVPRRIHHLLQDWLRPGLLEGGVPWTAPAPHLRISTDASPLGWGYQSPSGHQGSGEWSRSERDLHINVRELLVPWIFLRRHPTVRDTSICFAMDSQVAVYCINAGGSSRSWALLDASERLHREAESRGITLSAVYVPGQDNVWADALSRHSTSSVEWGLTREAFQDLTDLYGTPQVDLFASVDNHLLPRYIARMTRSRVGGPDAFQVDWSRWSYIYLFPPPTASVLGRVVARLRSYRGRVMLVAPLWKAQPWCQTLLLRCPSPLPLNRIALHGHGLLQSGISSSFHVWIFSGNA